jgi:hypothetical protein
MKKSGITGFPSSEPLKFEGKISGRAVKMHVKMFWNRRNDVKKMSPTVNLDSNSL